MSPCGCPPDTFWSLFRDAAHWEFELFLILIFDVVVGALLWPFISKHLKHHFERDKREETDAKNTYGD